MAPKKQKKTQKADTTVTTNETGAKEDTKANDNQESQQQESENPTVTTNETGARKSGRKRGVCAMYKVIVKKTRGKKTKVACDEWGIPNGETRARLQSYIGMLARTTVPIDIGSWPVVDPELKSKIWLDIQVLYNFFILTF